MGAMPINDEDDVPDTGCCKYSDSSEYQLEVEIEGQSHGAMRFDKKKMVQTV